MCYWLCRGPVAQYQQKGSVGVSTLSLCFAQFSVTGARLLVVPQKQKAMTEELRVYHGKKRMTGGTASPSPDPMSLGMLQWACLAHIVSYLYSHAVWERGWGPRSWLYPSCPAPETKQVESVSGLGWDMRKESFRSELSPCKSSWGYTAWEGG